MCYSYDSFGNRTGQQATACPVNPASAAYNANNRVTFTTVNGASNGFDYDEAGDVLDDNAHQYLYDAEGRICAVAGTPLGINGGLTMMTGYIYDAEGTRVSKGSITTWSCDPTANGFTTTSDYIVGSSGEQLTETGAVTVAGVTTMQPQHINVWAGGKLLGTYDGNGGNVGNNLHFYFTDPLGTRRAQTDGSGVLEQTCFSLPFGDGETCGTTPTEHLFTGKERDQESGNDYFGARYYASTMGRWMSPDPSPAGVNVMNPQSWNLYNYALNNPLRMVDRNGYWATDIHAQIVTYSLQNYVSSGELNVLRARQYSMDADQSDQNRHSMANTGQSSQDALNGMWNYVRDEMNIVTSSTVGSGNSLNITGVNALGDAIHTLEDYTSPMHTDHAFMPMEWDGGTWPPSKWGPGLNHVLGEQSPDQDWSRIGLAVRLTMAAYLQSGEGCQSGKRCLTADNFEYEFQQNMTEYVNNFYATHNAGASSEAQKDAARQCALGNPAACD